MFFLVWRGKGILVPLIAFIGLVIIEVSHDVFPRDSIIDKISLVILGGVVALVCGYLLWWIDKKYTKIHEIIKKDSVTGAETRHPFLDSHDFFWIRMKYWAFIVGILIIWVAYIGAYDESSKQIQSVSSITNGGGPGLVISQDSLNGDAPFYVNFPGAEEPAKTVSFDSLPGCKIQKWTQVPKDTSSFYQVTVGVCDSATTTLDSDNKDDLQYFLANSGTDDFSVTHGTTTFVANLPAFWAFGTYKDGETGEKFYASDKRQKNYYYALSVKYNQKDTDTVNAFVSSFSTSISH